MRQWLTVREAAAVASVDKQTVYRWIWAGELAYTNVGSGKSRPRIRIAMDAIEAFMSARERQAA